MKEKFVPVFHRRSHTKNLNPFRNHLIDLFAARFSGNIAVEAEKDQTDLLMLLQKSAESFISYTAKSNIVLVLPVLRKQIDKGQQINRCFKYAQLIVISSVTESIGFI